MSDWPKTTIQQIVAAPPGWFAVWIEHGNEEIEAVALWALVETQSGLLMPPTRAVVGMIDMGGVLGFAWDMQSFERYEYR